MARNFADRLVSAVRARHTPAIVGLDPVVERLPAEFRAADGRVADAAGATEAFCRAVVDVVASLVPAVKVNIAFFEPFRGPGIDAYFRVISYAHSRGLLVIADVKRGDIGSTAEKYAEAYLSESRFGDVAPDSVPDAVTLAGYLGRGAVRPFIDRCVETGRGVFVLVRPSDPGADEVHEFGGGPRFYQHMAGLVNDWGARPETIGECGFSCVGAVVAPKDSQSTDALRASMPSAIFLVPGYGAQGATADACRHCFLPGGGGAVVNASRSVIYAFEGSGGGDAAGDWRAAVQKACRRFVAEIAECAGLAALGK
ncbi:MAG: orotidine-5'-phosphate decarboxylase [Phycisphaerae bacterium]|jgi:orotidine-5'-phosphate decarboxylase